MLRRNDAIEGIQIPGTTVKLSQYADDATVFASNVRSVVEIKKTTEVYESGSGAKFNFSPGKSAGMWIGRQNGPQNICGFDFSNPSLKILGIYFGDAESATNSWNSRIDKLDRKLDSWRYRNLSLRGKILIVNSLALSGLIFLASILSIPQVFVTKINKIIFKFIWSDKNELVKQSLIYQPVERGGLSLMNIKTKSMALQLKMINCVTNENCTLKWTYLSHYWTGRSLSKYSPDWQFLRSNLRLNSLYCPSIYDRLLNIFDKSSHFFLKLKVSDRSVRNVYSNLLLSDFEKPRCYAEWFPLQIDSWKSIWLSCMKGLSTGLENDLSWKIVHCVLPTCVYLKSWGLSNVNIYCRRCPNSVETIEHVFLECPVSLDLWKHFSLLLTNLTSIKDTLFRKYIFLHMFPFGLCKKKKDHSLYLIKLVKYEIW